jgi:hypothetical protein
MRIPMIGMTYYLPALAEWRDGLLGRLVAQLSELATVGYNSLLTRTYQVFGVRSRMCSPPSTEQTLVTGNGARIRHRASQRGGDLHLDLGVQGAPRGPNEHPNQVGHALIARIFLQAAD